MVLPPLPPILWLSSPPRPHRLSLRAALCSDRLAAPCLSPNSRHPAPGHPCLCWLGGFEGSFQGPSTPKPEGGLEAHPPPTTAHSIYPLCQPKETNPTLYPEPPNTPGLPASTPALPAPTSLPQPRVPGAICTHLHLSQPGMATSSTLLDKTQQVPVPPSTLSIPKPPLPQRIPVDTC